MRFLCLLWLLSFSAAGEECPRIPWTVVHANFIMQMGCGRSAGRPDICDEVPSLHLLSDFHVENGEMAVTCGQAVPMIDDQEISVSRHSLGIDNLPVGGRVNLGAKKSQNV